MTQEQYHAIQGVLMAKDWGAFLTAQGRLREAMREVPDNRQDLLIDVGQEDLDAFNKLVYDHERVGTGGVGNPLHTQARREPVPGDKMAGDGMAVPRGARRMAALFWLFSPIGAAIMFLLSCLFSCGKQPLNRVQPKTEVIYSKDREPCSKGEDEVSDNVDGGEDQATTGTLRAYPVLPSPPSADPAAEDSGVGTGPAPDEAFVFRGPNQLGRKADENRDQDQDD